MLIYVNGPALESVLVKENVPTLENAPTLMIVPA